MSSTQTRTDIHRPSSTDFDPQSYDFLGCVDFAPEYGDGGARVQAVDRLIAVGGRFAAHQEIARCGHCGTHIRYAALLLHTESHEAIWVGETCLDNRFELTKDEFQALRKAASLHRERTRKADRIAALVDAHPLLADLTYYQVTGQSGSSFVSDIADKLLRYGELSERQVAAVERALRREIEQRDRRAAERAQQEATATPAPTGRTRVTGEIVSIRTQDGYWGTEIKVLVRDDRGFKVWTTLPAAIGDSDKGERVSFTATLKVPGDDQFFAIGSRPAQATVLAA